MERKKVSCAGKNMLMRSIRSADLHNLNLEVNQMWKRKTELDEDKNCDNQKIERSPDNFSDGSSSNSDIQAQQKTEIDKIRKRKADFLTARWSHSGFEEQNGCHTSSSSQSINHSTDSSTSSLLSPQPKRMKSKKKKKKSKKKSKSKEQKNEYLNDSDSSNEDFQSRIQWKEIKKDESKKSKKKNKKCKKNKSKKKKKKDV